MKTVETVTNAMPVDCLEETNLKPNDLCKTIFGQLDKYENLELYKKVIGEEKVFTNLTKSFVENFKPEKAVSIIGTGWVSKRFLVAEKSGLEIILYVGGQVDSPSVEFAIFLRQKREIFLEPKRQIMQPFGKELIYDVLYSYDAKIGKFMWSELSDDKFYLQQVMDIVSSLT